MEPQRSAWVSIWLSGNVPGRMARARAEAHKRGTKVKNAAGRGIQGTVIFRPILNTW